MIASNPDLVGIYVAGGGPEGVMAALRDERAGDRIVTVCNELTSFTRAGLIDGTLDVVLNTPIVDISHAAVDILARATLGESWDMVRSLQFPAEMIISESL
jgi:LacI family transcriptional regulator